MGEPPRPGQLISLTLSPKLDAALREGWSVWIEAARAEGSGRTAAWLVQRLRKPELKAELFHATDALLDAADAEDLVFALTELAELVGDSDDVLSDTLWEGVLTTGLERDDAEVIFDATVHLAAIAEDLGDPLAAAEYFIEFLNWRRQDEHVSDVEAVETAFDEVVRFALADGEHRVSAVFAYRQANYTRLAETDDDSTTTGEWERNAPPYTSWA